MNAPEQAHFWTEWKITRLDVLPGLEFEMSSVQTNGSANSLTNFKIYIWTTQATVGFGYGNRIYTLQFSPELFLDSLKFACSTEFGLSDRSLEVHGFC